MSIYVDELHRYPDTHRPGTVRRWCHMVSDESDSRLIGFAKQIGLKPSWLQKQGKPEAHFDLGATKRIKAIRAGAVPVTARRLVEIIREKRKKEARDE